MKQKIDVIAYAGPILEGVRKGALMTTAVNGNVNTMTIGTAFL
jgi:hypothetical protein